METPLLIDYTEFTKDKLIPALTDQDKLRLESSIREAQQFDLRPVLGDAMYYDILLNYDGSDSSTDKYDDLILGTQYTNQNNETIIFSGLRMCIKYWAYARYLSRQQVNVTARGIAIKTNPHSDPVDSKTISVEVQSARSGAVAYFEEAKKFLNGKQSTYTLWKGEKVKTRSGFRITAVGGDGNCSNKKQCTPKRIPAPNQLLSEGDDALLTE